MLLLLGIFLGFCSVFKVGSHIDSLTSEIFGLDNLNMSVCSYLYMIINWVIFDFSVDSETTKR